MLRSQIQKTASWAGLVALAAVVSGGTARADIETVFTNTASFSQYESSGIGDYAGAGDVVWAMPFTAASTANLADAMLALGNYSGSNTPITLDLESDASGTPGTLLATLTQQGTIPQYFSPGLVTFDYNGPPLLLTSGTAYWLVALETDPNSQQAWFLSNGSMGIDAVNYNGSATGPWIAGCPPGQGCSDSLNAFQVDGSTLPITTPVPEPPSLSFLGLVLMTFAAIVIRRRRAMGF